MPLEKATAVHTALPLATFCFRDTEWGISHSVDEGPDWWTMVVGRRGMDWTARRGGLESVGGMNR